MTTALMYTPKNIVNKRTEEIRYQELIKDVMKHEHKDELIELMYQQIQDDKY